MTNFKTILVGALCASVFFVPQAGAATTIGNTTYYQPGDSTCENRLSIGLEDVHKSTVAGVVTSFAVNPSTNEGSVAFKTTEYNTTTFVVKVTGTSALQPINASGL